MSRKFFFEVLVGLATVLFCQHIWGTPLFWVCDADGTLGTVDVATGEVQIVGQMSTIMLDIAFDSAGNLWGVSVNNPQSDLYRISKLDARTTRIGDMGNPFNSLVFGSDGLLYSANNGLYEVDVESGATSLIGSGGGYLSSGDLAFVGDNLYLTSLSFSTDQLYRLNKETGSGSKIGEIGYSNVLGLATDHHLNLYGLSGTKVLLIDTSDGSAVSIVDYGVGQSRLGHAFGAAIMPESNLINPGFNDAWYDPQTDGQGILISVLPETGIVFLAWFTFDTDLPPEDAMAQIGDPGHRWLTAQGPYADNQAVMDVTITRGGIFDSPSELTRTDPPGSDGTLIITFDDCYTGTIEYDLPSIAREGTIPIRRIVNDNVPLCEELASQEPLVLESDPGNPIPFAGDEDMNPGLSDAWYNPLVDGQGFLVSVLPETSLVFVAWFTYDSEAPPEAATANLGDPGHRWLTAQGALTGKQAVMDLTVTSGGLFNQPGEIKRTDPPGSDGTMTLTFDDCYSGTVEYQIPALGKQGTIPIQRIANDNAPLCEMLMER